MLLTLFKIFSYSFAYLFVISLLLTRVSLVLIRAVNLFADKWLLINTGDER
jgi:hypothetical protein